MPQGRNDLPRSLNDGSTLWHRLGLADATDDFIRQFRITACPVEGDDDVDDDEDDEVTEPAAPRPLKSSKNLPRAATRRR
jgi:hypothetical protein